MIKNKYDTIKYPFLQILSLIFDTNKLNNLHIGYQTELLKRENDQKTIFHKKYYDNFQYIKPVYDDFIKDIVMPIWNEPIVYQKIPTFRIQMPNNVGVGEWHKDKQYNHNQEEINFFLPFTDAFDTNTIWFESEEDKGDYKPMEANYGEFVIWEGVRLTHGNKLNETNVSRVSVDFRIIPYSKWSVQEGQSINTNVKFDIGGYYELCK
jgi:ectoine hydroxylase-related dioxygenase (phytanoyl-CoA dioxygenase family)